MTCANIAKLILLACVVSSLVPAAAFGEEPAEDDIGKGLRLMRSGRWGEAEKLFLQAARLRPGDPDITALLGISRYHLGKYALAEKNFAFALSKGTQYRARILYYRGMGLGVLGYDASARMHFERLLSEFPDSREAGKIRASAPPKKQEPRREKEKEKLKISVVLNAIIDSNVSLTTENNEDTLLFSFISARIGLDPAPLFLNFSFTAQEYLTEDDFDLYFITAGAEAKIELTKRDTINPAYSHKQYWLNFKSIDAGDSYELLWRRDWGKGWFSTARYRAGTNEYVDDDYETLTGGRKEAQVRIWKKYRGFGPPASIGVELCACDQTTKEDYFSYELSSGKIFWKLDLSDKTEFSLEMGLEDRDYDEINPNFGIRQSDAYFRAGASLLQQTSESAFFELSFDFVSVDSNIATYDCSRWRAGAGLILIF